MTTAAAPAFSASCATSTTRGRSAPSNSRPPTGSPMLNVVTRGILLHPCPSKPFAGPPIVAQMKLEDVNLLEDTWERGVPQEMFELLRREGPVFRHAEP